MAHRHAGRWRTYKGGFSDELAAVSALAADDAWAVGRSGVNIASEEEVILHWNGSGWVDMSRRVDVVALDDVLALARDDAWAVGTTRTEGIPYPDSTRPVVEHWDGHRWTRLSLPGTPWKGTPSLHVLAAFGPNDVWAGGSAAGRPALLHWDGARWRTAPPPAVVTPISALAAAGDGTLWAAGRGFVAHSRCR